MPKILHRPHALVPQHNVVSKGRYHERVGYIRAGMLNTEVAKVGWAIRKESGVGEGVNQQFVSCDVRLRNGQYLDCSDDEFYIARGQLSLVLNQLRGR